MDHTHKRNPFFIILAIVLLIVVSCLVYLHQKKYINLLAFNKKKPDIIFENCANMMNSNNCSIMGISPDFSPEVKQIYLPNYGPLDADLYRSLLRAGPGMCQVIKKDCSEDIQSEMCQLGIALYSDN